MRSSVWGGGPDLNSYDLPPADGLILVAAHPGQGAFLERIIDPSVVDEADPVAADWRLDMYDGRNGWRRPPESSRVRPRLARGLPRRRGPPGFEARRDRVDRIEAASTSADLLTGAPAGQLTGTPGVNSNGGRRPWVSWSSTARAPIPPIAISASNRTTGASAWYPAGGRPSPQLRVHPGSVGSSPHGRGCPPWSGQSSLANLRSNLAQIRVPTFVVGVSADEDIYPSDFHAPEYEAAAAPDKQYEMIDHVNHSLLPVREGDATASGVT